MPLLRVPAPYDFELSTERFRAFGPDLANLWVDGALHRVVAGREVRLAPGSGGVLVDLLDPATEPVVGRLLGLEFDLAAFGSFANEHDRVLARLVERLAGFRPPLAPDPFEALVTSITAQQVSLQAAFAVRNRLIARFGSPAGRAYSFPSPEHLAGAEPEELAALGFSRRKAEYVVGLARSPLDLAGLRDASDADVKALLRSVRGLGEWTADWFLARHLARPRAWPAGDLGLRKAVSAFYGAGRELSTEEVRALADRFDPFQNLTAHYLLTGKRLGFDQDQTGSRD